MKTPETDAIADEIEHLGPGGRALYMGKLFNHARKLEQQRDKLLEALKNITHEADLIGVDGNGINECPWCGAVDEDNHSRNCELLKVRAVIAEVEGK